MTRVAIIAAMPGELKPLVRGWPHSTRNGVEFWAQRNEEEEWIAACSGAGLDAATRAFAAIENGGPVDLLVSVGWAGALTSECKAGEAYNVAGVIDVRTGERILCDAGAGDRWLATSPKVADETEVLLNGAAQDYEQRRDAEAVKVLELSLEKLIDKSGSYQLKDKWKLERIYFLLGKCYQRNEVFDKAAENYIETLRLNPNHWEAKYNLEMIQPPPGGGGDGGKQPSPGKPQPKI